MISQIQKNELPVISSAMDPTGQASGIPDIGDT
jgi:hypothetical protein